MSEEPSRSINGLLFTKEYSYISVLYTTSCLVIDFPYDTEVREKIKRIPGARWNTFGDKRWTLPKNASQQLKDRFSDKYLLFKSKEEIQQDAKFFSLKEETIEDVLKRIPKNIDASFMKLPPKNFQKVTMGWIDTPKGLKGNIYGGILGDKMGLGKTIQALASAAYLKHIGKIKRCLIVTEAGLKGQWAEETERFTNEKYIVIESKQVKDLKPFEYRRQLLETVRTKDIFYTITNYDLLSYRETIGTEEVIVKGKTKKKEIKGDYTDLKAILENDYDMIILDEAQKIKNLDTHWAKAIYQIQSPKYRLIMTGTPIENNIENIFPLIDYLSPNIFADASLSVKERIQSFEDKFLIKKLNPHALPKRVPEPVDIKNLTFLNQLLMPYMLQRTLDDVSDEMPKSDVQIERLDWEDEQFKFYNQILETLKTRNEEWGDAYKAENAAFAKAESRRQIGKPDRKLEENYQNLHNKRILLENEVKALRLYAVEICDTPELMLWSESPIAHRLLLKNSFFSKIHKKAQRIRSNPALSEEEIEEKLHILFEKEVPVVPKLQFYMDKIEELCLHNNEKVITFTKFETMSRILKRKVSLLFDPDKNSKKKNKRKPLAQSFLYTGATKKGCRWKSQLKKKGTPIENPSCLECPFLDSCHTRRKSQWHLQNDPFTKLLIATDAANAGVNLQSARYNFNYDLPDSPAKYNQRNGRIQRIGSPHKVVVFFNLVTVDGIDELKYKRILKKQENINTAINVSEEHKAIISQTAEEMEDNFDDDVNLEEEQDLISTLVEVKK